MAATAVTQRTASMAWAALRARPRPEAIIANPAPANGTSRIKRKQSTAEISDSGTTEGVGKGIILLPPEEPGENARRARARATPPPGRQERMRRAHRPTAAGPPRTPQFPIPQPAIENPRVSWLSACAAVHRAVNRRFLPYESPLRMAPNREHHGSRPSDLWLREPIQPSLTAT